MLKNVTSFKGVFSRDTLTGKPKINESGILNLEPNSMGGSHWTCWFNPRNSKYIEYFDSYGIYPPTEAVTYLKKSGKQILYNSNTIQLPFSIMCGYYCMHFITSRMKGISFYDVVYEFDATATQRNENLIKSKFRG